MCVVQLVLETLVKLHVLYNAVLWHCVAKFRALYLPANNLEIYIVCESWATRTTCTVGVAHDSHTMYISRLLAGKYKARNFATQYHSTALYSTCNFTRVSNTSCVGKPCTAVGHALWLTTRLMYNVNFKVFGKYKNYKVRNCSTQVPQYDIHQDKTQDM